MIRQELSNALAETIANCREAVYAEEESDLHSNLTADRWASFKNELGIAPPAKILDLGCGTGFASEMFRKDGFDVMSATASREEFAGYKNRKTILMEMHDVCIFEGIFDAIWCRHVLEHSFAPYMVLRSMHRALKTDGGLYVEVPAADTSSKHETNASHWSIMGPLMWEQLLARAGFSWANRVDIRFATALGDDLYHSWMLRKS